MFLLICVSVSCPATPKSASFTSPCSESSTLAAARHRTPGVTRGAPPSRGPRQSCAQALSLSTLRPKATGPCLRAPASVRGSPCAHPQPEPQGPTGTALCGRSENRATAFLPTAQRAGSLSAPPHPTSVSGQPLGLGPPADTQQGQLTPDTSKKVHCLLRGGPSSHRAHSRCLPPTAPGAERVLPVMGCVFWQQSGRSRSDPRATSRTDPPPRRHGTPPHTPTTPPTPGPSQAQGPSAGATPEGPLMSLWILRSECR